MELKLNPLHCHIITFDMTSKTRSIHKINYSWAPMEMYTVTYPSFPHTCNNLTSLDEFIKNVTNAGNIWASSSITFIKSPLFQEVNFKMPAWKLRSLNPCNMYWECAKNSTKKYIKISDDGLYEVKTVLSDFDMNELEPGKYILVSKSCLKYATVV